MSGVTSNTNGKPRVPVSGSTNSNTTNVEKGTTAKKVGVLARIDGALTSQIFPEKARQEYLKKNPGDTVFGSSITMPLAVVGAGVTVCGGPVTGGALLIAATAVEVHAAVKNHFKPTDEK
jgi:hypothetical protein